MPHWQWARNPILQPLRRHRFSIDVVRCPQWPSRTASWLAPRCVRVNHIDRVAGKVDKVLLAAHMRLPHHWPHPPIPGVKMLAEPGVTKPIWGLCRYSSHNSARVVPGQRSSTSIAAQSGTGRSSRDAIVGLGTATTPSCHRPNLSQAVRTNRPDVPVTDNSQPCLSQAPMT